VIVFNKKVKSFVLLNTPFHRPHVTQNRLKFPNRGFIFRTFQKLTKSGQFILILPSHQTMHKRLATVLRLNQNKTSKNQKRFANLILKQIIENLTNSVQPKQNLIHLMSVSEKDFLDEEVFTE
jgi:hypothetical protein